MKILVVCQYYYPENFQVTPICEQLVCDGYNVTVLTGLPNYPTGNVPEEYKKSHRDEMINGVHVIRCFEIGRRKGALPLALNYISFWISSLKAIDKLPDNYDLVFVYQLSPIMMGLAGRKYSKKYQVPMFLYCCDLWPESLKIYIRSEKNLIFRIFKNISKTVYTSSEKIAVQSISFISYLKETHGISEDKMVYIPAFADDTYLSEDFYSDNGRIDFVFLGNLGIAQDLFSVLKAIQKIKDVPGFSVHFVGDGTCLNALKSFTQKANLENIIYFYGRRPVEEMPKYYKLADACLVSLKANNQTGLTLPSKIQGYMAAGIPVIGMVDGSAQHVIEESKCGLCVPAGDIDGLAKAMKDFIINNTKYAVCGRNGREYFKEHFCKSQALKRLEEQFDMVGRK